MNVKMRLKTLFLVAGCLAAASGVRAVRADSPAPLGSPEIVCAASDTPDALKGCARYICPADDARETLQRAINEAARLGVRCLLLPGKYVINSRSDVSPKGALYSPNYEGQN